MLLTPQHFQQEGARIDTLLAWQTIATNPYGWGVRELVIDEARLSTGTVSVLRLEAILPNGMAVSYDASSAQVQDMELKLELAPWDGEMTQRDVDVYLVLGNTRSLRQPGQPAMFRGIESAPVEDEVSEALPATVPRMAVNLALMADALPSFGYASLRLMTVNKVNEIVRRGAFLPAMLQVPAEAPMLRRARELATQMRSKALFLARQTAQPSSRTEDRLNLLEQKSRLASLILNLPLLEAVSSCPVVQPLPLYLALCAQLGALTTLRPGAVPLMPPAYDHGDSAAMFDTVLTALSSLVAEVIGSKTVWTSLTDRRVSGAARVKIDVAEELGLRASSGYTLFSIELSEQFIVPDQPLLISNPNESLLAQRPQEVVLFIKG